MDQAKVNREKKLRRAILSLAENAKAGGGIDGDWLASLLEDHALVSQAQRADAFFDLEKFIHGLCMDLVNLGLLTMQDTRAKKNQPLDAAHQLYNITAKGTGLLAGVEPKCPLVEDERI